MNTRTTDAPRDGRRLLLITYSFPPDGFVGGLRWGGLTKYLTRLGWKVSVVTAAPRVGSDTAVGARVESCPRLWTLIDGYRSLARLSGGLRRLFPHAASHGARGSEPPGLWRRLSREVAALLDFPDEGRGWIVRAALRAHSVIGRFKPQVIVSSGPPHAAHLVAGIARIGSRARWFIDLRDPWAGPHTKAWEADPRVGSRTYRALCRPLERLAFGAAHGVITNTQQLAQALAARYPDVSIVCVPNGVDPEGLPPPALDPYPGLGIAYAGTLYGSRGVGPVVQALRILFDRHPEAAAAGSKLRFAGRAELLHARALENDVAAAGLEHYVEVLGSLPRAQALNMVSRSRLAVVLAQEQGLQVPAKLYESVAMGIPTLVVAPADSAAGVEGRRVGAVVRDSDDVEGIARVLEQLWRDDSCWRSPCPVPITYEAIAPAVDKLLKEDGVAA